MSASHEWTEWHLTLRGWGRGSYQTDSQKTKQITPPEDRVLTCVYDEYLSSAYSELEKTVAEKWRSDNEKAIIELIKRYHYCPVKKIMYITTN